MRIINRGNVPWFLFVMVATIAATWIYLGNFAPTRLPESMTRMFVGFLQLAVMLKMLLVVGGISNGMKMTSDHRLWFIRFGPDHAVETMMTLTHKGVAPEEIHRSGAET